MSFITRLKALLPSFTANTADNRNASRNSARTQDSLSRQQEDKNTETPMPDIGTQTRISAAPKDNLALIPAANMSSEMDHQKWNDCWKTIEQYPGWDNPANRQLQAEAAARAKESTAGSSRGGATPPTPGSGVRAYFGSSPPLPTLDEDDEDAEMKDVDADGEGGRDVMELLSTDKLVPEDAELFPSLDLGESPLYVQTPGGPYSMDEDIVIGAETEVTRPPAASRTSAIANSVAEALQLPAAQVDPVRPSISPLTQISENPSPAYSSLAQGQSSKGDPTASQAAPAKSPTLETLLPGITSQTQISPPQPKVVHLPQATTTFTQPASPGFPYAIQPVASAAPSFNVPVNSQQQVDLGLAPLQVEAATTNTLATSNPITAPITPSLPPPKQELAPEVLTYAPPQQINIDADLSPELAPQQGNDPVTDATQPRAMPVKLPESFRAAVLEEAVAKGATADEQHLIMRGLRAVERSATMDDLGKIEGAMEVDASELPEIEDDINGDGDGDGDGDMVAPSDLEAEMEMVAATKGKGRKRKSDACAAGTNKKKAKAAKDIKALSNEEHLSNGWEYMPRSHFQAMKVSELNGFIRTLASQSRWWNGLNKKSYIDKIMEWQEEMRVLQEGVDAEDSSDEEEVDEEGKEEKSVAVASRTSTKASSSLRASMAPRTHSKSKTLSPETPADAAQSARNMSASSISSDRSIFFDPAASPRSTNLLPKLRAVKKEDNEGDVVENGGPGLSEVGNEIQVLTASEVRRSRSKTADSAKHGVRGKSQASKKEKEKSGQGRKSLEPSGAEVSERARSLRRRTASVASEGYGA